MRKITGLNQICCPICDGKFKASRSGWNEDYVREFDNQQAEFFIKVLKVGGIFLLLGVLGIFLIIKFS